MTRINVFCLPFAGGSKYSYKGYQRYTPPNLNLIPLDIPGRGERFQESVVTNIYDVVEDLFGRIKDQLHQPYALYGHSMGGLLSYLLTRRIQEAGLDLPCLLFITGRGAPSVPPTDQASHMLPQEAFKQRLQELGGMVDEVLENDDLFAFFEPILRADFASLSSYTYQSLPPLNVPMQVLIGTHEKVTVEHARAWQKETTAPVTVRQLPGNHFFIYAHEKVIMELMSRCFHAPVWV